MSETRLLAARWLLDGGAGVSACRLLGGLRGSLANDLREESASAALRPGVYALVVHDDDGLVLPLRPRIGLPSAASVDLRAACTDALAATRAWFGVPSLPSLRLELEELLAVSGTSLGLASALAFVMHFAPAAAPRRAVLATGRLDAQGRVLAVAHMDAKLAAAAAEVGERIVLVPPGQRTSGAQIEVSSLAEAIDLALGPARTPDVSLIALDAMIERARSEPDPLAATALLEAVDLEALPAADRGRVHLELGTALRHAGRTDAAVEHHAHAQRILATERLVIGAETAERYELEVWLTAMDGFRLDAACTAISSRLREPFLSARNELRCRGMLAQTFSMQGNFAEAVRVREANLPLHALSDDLARVLPGTLCYLALDSARAGDTATFERHAHHLVTATRPGDVTQWRYTAYALVRALVALERFDEALAWAKGTSSFAGIPAPPGLIALVGSTDAITTHPETTLARTLVRAHRRTSSLDQALTLGRRVTTTTATTTATTNADLNAWVARLVELEVALGEHDAGRDPTSRLLAARTDLRALHRAASEYYPRLLACPVDELARELDHVFY